MTGSPGAPVRESEFSPPTSLCPNPSWWTATDEDSAEIEVSELLAGLVRGAQPDYCIETGSAWGQTAHAIGEALADNGHGHLHSLEIDEQRVAYAKTRVRGLPVTVHCMSSLDFVPTAGVGFAFFDSLFDLRVAEFDAFLPWMRTGTVVAFHDTAPGHGITPAGVDLRTHIQQELAALVDLIHLSTPRGLTVGVVR